MTTTATLCTTRARAARTSRRSRRVLQRNSPLRCGSLSCGASCLRLSLCAPGESVCSRLTHSAQPPPHPINRRTPRPSPSPPQNPPGEGPNPHQGQPGPQAQLRDGHPRPRPPRRPRGGRRRQSPCCLRVRGALLRRSVLQGEERRGAVRVEVRAAADQGRQQGASGFPGSRFRSAQRCEQ